jgi:peptide/nickel transport system substrate-binding protein
MQPLRLTSFHPALIALLLLISACSPGTTNIPITSSGSPKSGGRLVMTLDIKPISSLDPVVPSDNSAIWTILNLYDQLFRVAKDARSVEPDAVERYEVSADGLIYTFYLRDGLVFSDGTPVTMDDVIFSLQRMLASEHWGWLFPEDAVIEALDTGTFQIQLKHPNAALINKLAGFWSSIVPRKSVEVMGEKFWEKPISSGPFRVKEWVRGRHITLERNPYYWGEPAYLDEVELQLVTDDNTRMLKFQAGELDIATNVPFNQVAVIDASDGASVQIAPLLSVDFIGINASRPPLDDVNVRLALNYATNKQAIIDAVLFGYGEEASTGLPKMMFWEEPLQGYPYNLKLAREYLHKSSVPDGFEVAYAYRGDSVPDAQIGVLLQEQWRQIGVNLQLEPMEAAVLRQRMFNNDFDLGKLFNSADVIDPSQLSGVYLCRQTQQVMGVCNEGIDQIYAESETMMAHAERAAAFHRMMQMANEWAIYIPLYNAPARTAISDRAHGFQVLPTGNFRLWEVWVEN